MRFNDDSSFLGPRCTCNAVINRNEKSPVNFNEIFNMGTKVRGNLS